MMDIDVMDSVKIKSGGPEFIVLGIGTRDSDGAKQADCAWLSARGEVQRQWWPVACLVLCHRHGDEWPRPEERK